MLRPSSIKEAVLIPSSEVKIILKNFVLRKFFHLKKYAHNEYEKITLLNSQIIYSFIYDKTSSALTLGKVPVFINFQCIMPNVSYNYI